MTNQKNCQRASVLFLLLLSFYSGSLLAQDDSGCTDPEAVNFNPYVDLDDGSCLYAGCLNPLACNYDATADVSGLCEYPGCADPEANNYTSNATCYDEGVCDYNNNDLVSIETYAVHEGIVGTTDLTGYLTSRVYVHINPSDQFSAIYGLLEDDDQPDGSDILVDAECDCFEEENYGGLLAKDHSCNLYDVYPELEFDSYFTVNQTSSCDEGNTYMVATSPSDYATNPMCEMFIDDGAIFVISNTANSWPDADGKVLIAQMTTCGDYDMKFCVQYFIDADPKNIVMECVICSFEFGCVDPLAPNFDPYANTDDGSCLPQVIPGCMNEEACNYYPEANYNTVCFYPECLDPLACNYVDAAFCEDQSACEFFESGTLEGMTMVEVGQNLTYTYLGETNGNYTWVVEGGEVVEYIENNIVVIEWTVEGAGSIMVIDNSLDCPGSSDVLTIVIDGGDSVAEQGLPQILTYPNPAADDLKVEIPAELIGKEYQVIDASGKMVLSGNFSNNTNTIDIRRLAAGQYTLHLEGAEPTPIFIRH